MSDKTTDDTPCEFGATGSGKRSPALNAADVRRLWRGGGMVIIDLRAATGLPARASTTNEPQEQ